MVTMAIERFMVLRVPDTGCKTRRIGYDCTYEIRLDQICLRISQ